MDDCYPNGSMTKHNRSRRCGTFLGMQSRRECAWVTIWAMNDDCGSLCHPSLSYTCPWFVPELRRFVLGSASPTQATARRLASMSV